MKKGKTLFVGLLFLVPFFLLVEKSSLREFSRSSPPKNLHLLETVFRYIRNDYIEEIDPTKVIEGTFRGLVNSLDSCSGYFDRQVTARYLTQKESLQAEPGLILFKKGGFPVVVGLIENSPAEKAGLRLGDVITEINHQSTTSMSLAEVNLLLRGKEGETFDLKVLREEKTLEIKVGRENLRVEAVSYTKEEKGNVILRVNRLNHPLLDVLKTEILPHLNFLDKPLIIDLRTCQEGTFEEARQLVNLFLKAESIGYLEKAGGKRISLPSPEEPLLPSTPLLLWISQATQGPAEAAAAVLKDNGRAKLVGQPTLGLAGVIDFFPLNDGTSLWLTTSVFCLPSGFKVWGQGVQPDAYVEGEDLSTRAYLSKSKNFLSEP